MENINLALFSAIRELGKLAPFRAIKDLTNLMFPKQKKKRKVVKKNNSP